MNRSYIMARGDLICAFCRERRYCYSIGTEHNGNVRICEKCAREIGDALADETARSGSL